jgi:hypothetical protein
MRREYFKQDYAQYIAPKDEKFKQHYEKYIAPYVKKFEEMRLEKLNSIKKRKFYAKVIFRFSIIIYPIIFIIFIQKGQIHLWPFFIMALFLFNWKYAPSGVYDLSVEETILPHIFSFLGKDFIHRKKGEWDIRSLQDSEIHPRIYKAEYENYIKGSYNGVGIEFAKTCLYDRNRYDSNETTTHKGILLRLDMNKKFISKTIVIQDSGKIGNFFENKSHKFENVTLEDPLFEKEFEVYSENQVEARYLLTASFMDRLLKLKEFFQATNIRCSFYDDKFLLMIKCFHNFFEPKSIDHPVDFEDDMQLILTEMNLIFQIIDILKLNQKIGL